MSLAVMMNKYIKALFTHTEIYHVFPLQDVYLGFIKTEVFSLNRPLGLGLGQLNLVVAMSV